MWGRRGLAALAVLCVILSFLPLWQTDLWWVRQWDYPRLQLAGLIVLLVAILLWVDLKRTRYWWGLIAAMICALGWQVSHFIAYLAPYPKEVADAGACPAGRRLSLLNANVLQTNDDYDAVLRLVDRHRPDVVLLLETGPDWRSAMAPLGRHYPYRLLEPVPSTYGMMLYSRLPMTGEVRHLLQPGVPSMAVSLRLDGGQSVDLYALHPEPPWPGDDSGERDAELISTGRELREKGRAALVVGDLNDVAWSRTSRLFKKVAGVGDPRIGRGFYPTFNAKYPLLRWPLDHLFVSPHWEIVALDRLGDISSDHFPILFRVCLTERAGERKVAPDAPVAVEEDASEELVEGKQEKREEDRGQ